MFKIKKSKDEYMSEDERIKIGIVILKSAAILFAIVSICFLLGFMLLDMNINSKINLFTAVYWVDMALNMLALVIAFNMINKYSVDIRYQFFTKHKKGSVDYKARIWILIHFSIMLMNIGFLMMLSVM